MKKKSIIAIITAIVVCAIIAIISVYAVKQNEDVDEDLPVNRVPVNMKLYSTEEELDRDAKLIVIGFVKTNLDEDIPLKDISAERSENSTISTFYIEKVLRGEYDKPTLTLIQAAVVREHEGEKYIVTFDEYDALKKSNTYILYLDNIDEAAKKAYELPQDSYGPLSLYHGVINLNEEVKRTTPDPNGYDYFYERVTQLRNEVINRFRDDIKEVTGLEFKEIPSQ